MYEPCEVPIVTNVNILPTIAIHNQERELWELMKWSSWRICSYFYQILATNSLRKCLEISRENFYVLTDHFMARSLVNPADFWICGQNPMVGNRSSCCHDIKSFRYDIKHWNYIKKFDHSNFSLCVVNKEKNIWGDDSSFCKPTIYTQWLNLYQNDRNPMVSPLKWNICSRTFT